MLPYFPYILFLEKNNLNKTQITPNWNNFKRTLNLILLNSQLIFHIIWRSHFIFSHENHWATWSLWIEIFPIEIQLFSNTLSFNLNGRSHIIFSLGFCIWKEFEFMEIRKQIWKFGEVLLFPLIYLSKRFRIWLNFSQLNLSIYFNIPKFRILGCYREIFP